MEIGVIGINHKVADLPLREHIAKAFQRHFCLVNPFIDCSFVLLSTCNRSELYFSSANLANTHQEILYALKSEISFPFEQKLYTLFGLDCFIHLGQVTSGLDSAIIAETEIQGQVRQAYDAASTTRNLSKELHYLFQKSLQTGKEVRTHYQETKQLPDIEHILLHYANDFFGKELPTPLFIGASEINLKIARFFKKKGIELHICNRTKENASSFELELQANFLPWDRLEEVVEEYDWIICATKSPHFILKNKPLKSQNQKLLIDLSVPRNIHPELQNTARLVNIDELQSLLELRMQALDQKIIDAKGTIYTKSVRLITSFQSPKSICFA